MRLDTYSFRNHLIAQLESKKTGATVHLDDGDILMISLRSGELVEIHIIERAVDIEEIHATFARNQRAEIYTLYVMWCDMVLPEDFQVYEPEDWLLTLHAIYDQKVYGYKVSGSEAVIYPVHLEKLPRRKRRAHYGKPITIADIGCAKNQINSQSLEGEWFIADFNDTPLKDGYQRTYKTHDDRYRQQVGANHHLRDFYGELGLTIEADRGAVRKAYRQLAREFHPDLNSTPEATLRMQRLNEAYNKIIDWLDSELKPSA